MCELQTIWGIHVPSGKKVEFEIKDNIYSILTNVCLGKITKDEPTTVKMLIETILIDKVDSKGEAPVDKKEVVLTILTPGKFEQYLTRQVFSPLNKVYFVSEGPNDIYLSGYYDDVEDDDEEEEEEEEIDETDIDNILIQKNIIKHWFYVFNNASFTKKKAGKVLIFELLLNFDKIK